MRKIQLSILFLLATVIATHAAPVSPDRASASAIKFLTESPQAKKVRRHTANKSVTLAHVYNSSQNSAPLYYVYNHGENDGYVFISGDDRLPEVIGYSFSGQFDINNIPDNMKGLMRSWDAQIEWLLSHPEAHTAAAPVPQKEVAPLLADISWDQGDPYNRMCPNVTQYNSYGDKLNTKGPAATGCVATALGQIMYYHRWPLTATGSVNYISDNGDDVVNVTADFEGHQYKWEQMLPTLTKNSPAEAVSEVSTLLFHIGASFESVYGASTGATDVSVAPALKKYFNYDKGIRYVIRDFYTAADWNEMLQNELYAGRPVAYGGLTRRWEGHFFVLDGVNAEGYYHVNWGWGGLSNGYFRLNLLAPDDQGTGGSSSNDTFHYGQNMIIGIQKPSENPSAEQVCFTAEMLEDVSMTASRLENIPLKAFGVWNNSATDCQATLGFALVNADGEIIYRRPVIEAHEYPVAYGEPEIECGFSVPLETPAGTYTIRPYYQIASENYTIDHFISLPTGRADRWTAEVAENSIEISTTGKFKLSILSVTDENGAQFSDKSEQMVIKVRNDGTEFAGRAQIRCYIKGKQSTLGRTTLNGKGDAYTFMSIPGNAETEFVFDNTFNLPGHDQYIFEIRGCEGHQTLDGEHQSLAILAKASDIKITGPEMPLSLELEDNIVGASLTEGVMPKNDVRIKAFVNNDGGAWQGNFRMAVYDSDTGERMGYITFDEVSVAREAEQWLSLEGGEFPQNCEVSKNYDIYLLDPLNNEMMMPSDAAGLEYVTVGEPREKKAILSLVDVTINPQPAMSGEPTDFTFEVLNEGDTYKGGVHFSILRNDTEMFSSASADAVIKRGEIVTVDFNEVFSLEKGNDYLVRLYDADNNIIGEHSDVEIDKKEEPILSLVNVTVNPQPAVSGENVDFAFEVKNEGDSYNGEVYFAIIDSDAEKFRSKPVVATIEHGEAVTITFKEIISLAEGNTYLVRLFDATDKMIGEHENFTITEPAGLNSNAVQGNIKITATGIEAPSAAEIFLYAPDGSCVASTNSGSLDISTLTPGIYIVCVCNAETRTILKLVK